MAKFLASLFCVAAISVSCKPIKKEEGAEAQVIYGRDERILIKGDYSNLHARYHKLVPAVGLSFFAQDVELKKPLCTYFHIGKGIIMAAGHCSIDESYDQQPERIFENRTMKSKVDVHFNFTPGGKTHVSRIKTILYARNTSKYDGLDYGFWEIENAPEAFIKVANQKSPPSGEPIFMISGGRTNSLMLTGNCKLRREKDANIFLANMFLHKCDTVRGSSGGPIFSESDLTLIGVHFSAGENDFEKPDYPGQIEDVRAQREGSNGAMFLDAILRDMPAKLRERILN